MVGRDPQFGNKIGSARAVFERSCAGRRVFVLDVNDIDVMLDRPVDRMIDIVDNVSVMFGDVVLIYRSRLRRFFAWYAPQSLFVPLIIT